MRTAKQGSVVSILYKGGVKGEEPLDDRSSGEPLTVMIGNMQIPKGVENALVGMEVGESKQVEIPCELGYGTYQENLADWYPRTMLKDGYTLKVGDLLFYTNPDDGRRMPAWVTKETEDNVRIDFNHPFAGKTLDYWVKLVDMK